MIIYAPLMAFRPKSKKEFFLSREKVGREKGGERRGVGSVVNPIGVFQAPVVNPSGFP